MSEASQFHFLEYINGNQTFRLDSLRRFIGSALFYSEISKYHTEYELKIQCCGSGSTLILAGWIRIRVQVGRSDQKKEKRLRNVLKVSA
jgi:hypothetical protein